MISENIYFSKKERRIIYMIVTMVFSLQAFNFWLQPKQIGLSKEDPFKALILNATDTNIVSFDTITNWLNDKHKTNERKADQNPKINTPKTIFNFDPNTIDSTSLLQLGFKPFIIKNIIKYRQKGGQFKSCTELFKIYHIDSLLVKSLLDLCHCKPSKYPVDNSKLKNESTIVNINMADSVALKKLYGIGNKLSKRIVKYRDRLGGFHKLEQLTEVYGVSSEIITNNSAIIEVKGPLRKININNCVFEDLYAHYYIDANLANSIVKFRKQHGRYERIDQLMDLKLMNDSLYSRISPYLSID